MASAASIKYDAVVDTGVAAMPNILTELTDGVNQMPHSSAIYRTSLHIKICSHKSNSSSNRYSRHQRVVASTEYTVVSAIRWNVDRLVYFMKFVSQQSQFPHMKSIVFHEANCHWLTDWLTVRAWCRNSLYTSWHSALTDVFLWHDVGFSSTDLITRSNCLLEVVVNMLNCTRDVEFQGLYLSRILILRAGDYRVIRYFNV